MSTEYEPAEIAAKAAWEGLTPEPGTILWYEKWFADNTMDIPSTNSGWHYRALMATLKEWAEERAESGTDEGWLESYKDQYQQALEDTAEFEKRLAEEVAAKEAKRTEIKTQLAASGIGEGHAILPSFFAGAAQGEQNVTAADLEFGYLPLAKVGF